MDTITHGIAGALIAKAFFSDRGGGNATLAVTVGAIFPDSDILVAYLYSDKIAFLDIHRGATHSIVMLPVFALLLGILMCWWARERRKWGLFSILCGIGLASHIFLDVITAYGTMVWNPLSSTRISWDTIFIVDLVFTTIVLLPQLIAWVYAIRSKARVRGAAVWLAFTVAGVIAKLLTARVEVNIPGTAVGLASLLIGTALLLPLWTERLHGGLPWPSSSLCQAGITLMVLYLVLCGLAHQEALAQVQRYADREGIAAERIAAIPYPPSMLEWAGLIKSPAGVYRGMIDLSVRVSPSYAFFPNAAANNDLRLAEKLSDTQTFLSFARFPWIRYSHAGDQSVIEIQDMQFYLPRRNRRLPFTFQVLLDGEGRVISHGLLER